MMMTTRRPESSSWTNRVHSNLWRLAAWTAAWLITMALATFGPAFLWDANQTLTLGAVGLNALAGLGMIRANIRYLNALDEMMQKLQLEAMGLSLGVGVVGGLSYALLDTTNLISSDAEIAYVVMLMGLTYIVSTVVGVWRYR